MQKIHVHNDFDVHLNFDNIKTDYVSRVEFWTRRDDVFCCCKCDGSLKVEDDSNIVCYLNDHNLGTGKLNYNVIFQIPDPNYADGYKKVCQHYVSDIFLTADNGDTTVAIVKVLGDEEVTDLINRLSEFEKVFDNKQDKLAFDTIPTSGSKNVVYSDGIYNAIKNNKPDLSDYAKKTDLEGLASEQWVDDKGYLTEHQSLEGYAKKSDIPSLEGYVTETELNKKGYVPEKFESDDYNSHIDMKYASIFLDSQKWMKYVTLDPNLILVYDKGTKGQEIYTQLTTNTMGVVKSTDGKTDLAALVITDEGKGSLRIKDPENELNISVDGITIKEGFYEYNISRSNIKDIKDMAKKTDLQGLATEQWVDDKGYLTEHQSLEGYAKKTDLQGLATENWVTNQGYITSIPSNYVTESELDSKGYLTEHQSLDDYVKKSDLQSNTSIETVTVTPASDTEYTLNSNQYLKIIPEADAVKLTFKPLDNTDLMKEYHIVIDCNKAVPSTRFIGVLWELDNEIAFEKDKIYDVVIRYDGDNLYGNWKAYKLMPITILITTSDAAGDVLINGTTYKLAAGDNTLTDIGFITITDIDGFKDNNKITSIDFGGATIKIADLRNIFQSMSNLTKISNITSKTTMLRQMFIDCSSLVSLDVSRWNTSSVTDFGQMFYNCRQLKTLDVSNWDVSKATDLSGMFYNCVSLTSLDVSRWDTSSATDFGAMFSGCNSLTTLDLSNFNTSKATDFSSMFSGCSGLTTLDLSNFNTSKATDFSSMFSGCSGLTSLDVSSFNTSNVTSFYFMFAHCSGLTSLDLSHFDTSNVTDFREMFYNCRQLKTLDVSNWDTSSATDFSSMFYGCRGLTSLDVSNWDVSSATDFYNMFSGCSGLTSLDVSHWDTSKATDFGQMFWGCSGLTKLDVSNWNVSKGTYFTGMFSGCKALTTIRMVGCSQETIDKIKSVKPASATIVTE